MARFVHLHVHSEYSLLDGLAKVPNLVARAKELGMDAIAITDHGSMYGAIKFYNAANEAGIKPIFGVEAYMAGRTRFDKEAGVDKDYLHQLLLAKNFTGYQNLMKLVSLSHLEGFYYKPRIDKELLEKYHDGLIATSGCLGGVIPQFLLKKQDEEARKMLKWYVDVFGDDFYIELQRHSGIPELTDVNNKLVKLSREFGVPLIATNDSHYIYADDAEAQDALLAIQTKKFLTDKDRMTMLYSPDFYIKSEEEMAKLFEDLPEAIENTHLLAKKCNVEIPIGKWILPHFPLGEYKTPEDMLRAMCFAGLKKRFITISDEIKKRAEYELGIICSKGFATYFLIVQDFVNWAKNNGVRVGPGRGSVAGSIVAYGLRITSVNPLEHDIPFERFMNPGRPTPPDIDMDFADDQRERVIEYVTNRYGKEKVAQIITFGTMEARQAIRDIGRVMGLPYAVPDKLAKLIPPKFSIKEAMNSSFELQEEAKDPTVAKLLALAQRVEGVTRHASTHAAGVVIADKDITEYTPVQLEMGSNRIMTQYDMYSLDMNVSDKAVGLLKMDFLGLRNLTILGKAIEMVKHERNITLDLSDIPLTEKKVYEMISNGETTGVFQLESRGMRRLARQLKPNKFSEITAMVALFRPGPMELISDFVEGKKHPNGIVYLHPDLKPILSPTYGVAVYQEQCMQIAHKVAGYTMEEADNLRRAIGKKKKSIMEKEKKKFIAGAIKNKYEKGIATKIWGFIEKFVGYGFNIPHSVCYAMIAYQTAYMKVKYPVEYMTAVLTAESRATSGPIRDQKIALALDECKRLGVHALPPDINRSSEDFIVEEDKTSLDGRAIRFGLSAVKNVGSAAVSSMLSARNTGGQFLSLSDFLARVDGQKVNKKVIESLVKVGAFKHFGLRAPILATLDEARSRALSEQKRLSEGQTSLFGEEEAKEASQLEVFSSVPEFGRDELLAFEKELLGVYLTEHPLQRYIDAVRHLVSDKIGSLTPEESVGADIVTAGMVTQVRAVQTRKTGKMMCFATLEDETGSIDVVVFPTIYEKMQQLMVRDKPLLILGKVDYREEKLNLIAQEIASLETDLNPNLLVKFQVTTNIQSQTITIPRGTSREKLNELAVLLKSHTGKDHIRIILPNGHGMVKTIDLPYTVNFSAVEKEASHLLQSQGAST